MHINQRQIAGQRIDRERRAQRAAANTDVDQVLDLSQCAAVDRLDQHAHACEQSLALFDICIIPDAAHRAVRCRAAFGHIDYFAAKQFRTLTSEVTRLGQLLKPCDQVSVQMCL